MSKKKVSTKQSLLVIPAFVCLFLFMAFENALRKLYACFCILDVSGVCLAISFLHFQINHLYMAILDIQSRVECGCLLLSSRVCAECV